MTQNDWQTMLKILRWRYREDFLADEREQESWFNNCNLYPPESVDLAVRYYCEACDKEPTENEFLIALDEIHNGRYEDFFRLKSEAFVGCRRCNDHGYFFVQYPTGAEYQEECDCRKEEYLFNILNPEIPMVESECYAKFGFGQRFLDRDRARVIRKPRIQLFKDGRGMEGLEIARKRNATHADADSMASRPVIYEVRYGD